MMLYGYFIEIEYLLIGGALLSQIGLAAWHAGDWWADRQKGIDHEH